MAEKNIKGQIAIWVIVAIILVAAVILFFLIETNVIVPSSGEVSLDVQSYMQECTSDYVNEVVDKMLPQGGFVDPKNYANFNDLRIEYICKNIGTFNPCIQQHPLIIREMENEIKRLTEPKIVECFEMLEDEYRRAGFSVSSGGLESYEVDLEEDEIVLKLGKRIELQRNGETQRGNEHKIAIQSPAYNLAKIAGEIADQEAKYCNFEFVGYSVFNPRYKIEKYTMSDSTHIYTIKDDRSGKEMNIAIRGCAIQVGA